MSAVSSNSDSVVVSAGEVLNNAEYGFNRKSWYNGSIPGALDEVLDELNERQAILHLPLITFLSLLMLVGVSGNICVIYVYRTRFRKTSGSYFIMVLAILDLVTSGFCISWDIFCLMSPYKYPSDVVCKGARLFQSFLYLSAALVLVCVAFSRYYKVVKPLHCYSSGQAQSLTVVTMAMTLSLVWPQLLLSGMRTINLGHDEVTGQRCDIGDEMHDSLFTFLFHGFLYSVFILCFLMIVAFYFRILCVVCSLGKGQQLRSQVANRDYTPRSSASNMSERSFGSSQNVSITSRSQTRAQRLAAHSNTLCSVFRRIGRTTRMLALVTFVFLLGYLPFIAVHLLNFLDLGFQRPLTYGLHIAYELCLRSYLLSSAANPLIYSILNARFREESMVALRSLLRQLPLWIQKRVKCHHEPRR